MEKQQVPPLKDIAEKAIDEAADSLAKSWMDKWQPKTTAGKLLKNFIWLFKPSNLIPDDVLDKNKKGK